MRTLIGSPFATYREAPHRHPPLITFNLLSSRIRSNQYPLPDDLLSNPLRCHPSVARIVPRPPAGDRWASTISVTCGGNLRADPRFILYETDHSHSHWRTRRRPRADRDCRGKITRLDTASDTASTGRHRETVGH